MARVGWVESPLQLVNAVEYAAAVGDPVHLCLRAGVPQLGDTGRLFAPSLPRGVTMSGPWRSATRSPMTMARRRLIGDANSGQLRALTTFTGAQDLVVVDDGSGTLSLARRLAKGLPLARHGKQESALHRVLGAAASVRMRTAAEDGRLTVFTAYPEADAVGALLLAGDGPAALEHALLHLRQHALADNADRALLERTAIETGLVVGSTGRA